MSTETRQKVLAVVAHSDDEVLGCGGALAKHVSAGDDVAVVTMTNGVGSRGDSSAAAERRTQHMRSALQCLGVSTTFSFDFPDNAMDTVSILDVTQTIESVCQQWGFPDRVFTHHAGDLNIDHQITHPRSVDLLSTTTALPIPSKS